MNGCYYVPPQPEQPAIAPRIELVPDFGWNAGANSVDELDGDCELVWRIGRVVGVVIGLADATARDPQASHDRNRVLHGLYFQQDASGRPQVQAIEAGRIVSALRPYAADDEFTVRRVGGRVETLHKRSLLRSAPARTGGTLMAACAIYATDDEVPGNGGGAPADATYVVTADNGHIYPGQQFPMLGDGEAAFPPPDFAQWDAFSISLDDGTTIEATWESADSRYSLGDFFDPLERAPGVMRQNGNEWRVLLSHLLS